MDNPLVFKRRLSSKGSKNQAAKSKLSIYCSIFKDQKLAAKSKLSIYCYFFDATKPG